ncbi:MAG: Fur family transcriptional regulator [Capsulimonadales bacterium]|nr:Fur family transcriptional regulator [Capsulimonadales bacterium]
MAKSPEYARMLGLLKAQGYRVTGPRRALLRLLAQATKPLSVQEIHAAVNPPGTKSDDREEEINLVTVYRFANLLVDLGIARRVEFGQGYYRYERAESQDGPHHHHLVCERCGRIEEFQGCEIGNLTLRLEQESGFRVERHQLEVFGTCPQCQTLPQTSAAHPALPPHTA